MRNRLAHLLCLVALGFIGGCAEEEYTELDAHAPSVAAAATVHQVYDAFVSGDDAVIDSVYAPDFVEHEQLPGLTPNREGVKTFIGMWRQAFPDLAIEVHHVITQGDMTAAHATFRGTHRGEFMGVAPTGRQIAVPTIDIVRFENGRVAEHWGVTNEAALMRQLGLLPDEEPAAGEPATADPTGPADSAGGAR